MVSYDSRASCMKPWAAAKRKVAVMLFFGAGGADSVEGEFHVRDARKSCVMVMTSLTYSQGCTVRRDSAT
jgi:hypothetical protein